MGDGEIHASVIARYDSVDSLPEPHHEVSGHGITPQGKPCNHSENRSPQESDGRQISKGLRSLHAAADNKTGPIQAETGEHQSHGHG